MLNDNSNDDEEDNNNEHDKDQFEIHEVHLEKINDNINL